MRSLFFLLVSTAIAVPACSDASSQSESQADATTAPVAADPSQLDAWRGCIIDRIQRVDVATAEEIKQVDEQVEDLSERLAELSAELQNLEEQASTLQWVFDSGTKALNDMGRPGTIEQAREDPDIAAAYEAIETGENPVDAFAALSLEDSQALSHVMERERLFAGEEAALRTQKHEAATLHSEARRERDKLTAKRQELQAEWDATILELEAALSSTQPGDAVDWSLCADSR